MLELRGMFLGLQAAVTLVQGKTVALQGDNTTALAYVRNQGGTHSFQCCQEATQILLWAERHRVTLLPRFVRGESNVHADALSRRDQVLHTEWSMHPQVCERLWILWGRPEVDLFATSLNNKLPLFIAPMPEGPEESVDAFVQDWSNRFLYAYPPTKVIRRVLSKFVSSRESEMILITPMWPNQQWFPDLMMSLTDHPRPLPKWPNLLVQPHRPRVTCVSLDRLSLTAWRLSSSLRKTRVFQSKLQREWPTTSGRHQRSCTRPNGEHIDDGAVTIDSLQFVPLYP